MGQSWGEWNQVRHQVNKRAERFSIKCGPCSQSIDMISKADPQAQPQTYCTSICSLTKLPSDSHALEGLRMIAAPKKEVPGEGQAGEWIEEDEAPEHGSKEWLKQLQASSI